MAKYLIETQNKMYDDFHNLHAQTLIETRSIFFETERPQRFATYTNRRAFQN
jgi:hypothetical protein